MALAELSSNSAASGMRTERAAERRLALPDLSLSTTEGMPPGLDEGADFPLLESVSAVMGVTAPKRIGMVRAAVVIFMLNLLSCGKLW